MTTTSQIIRCGYILLLMLMTLPVFSQQSYLNNRFLLERIGNTGNLLTGNSGMLAGIPQAAPGVVGDSFLKNYFSDAAFLLFDKEQVVSGYQTKYDIQRDDFYLLQNRVVRVLEGSKVRNFVVIDSLSKARQQYINGRLLKDETGSPLSGFFEVLSDGKMALLRKTEIEVKAPDFHPALNVGSKDHRVVKHQLMFYAREGVVGKVPQGKKILSLFPDQEEKMASFIKVNKLDFKSESHLKGLFEYYQSLVK